MSFDDWRRAARPGGPRWRFDAEESVDVTRLGDHVVLQRGTTYKSALLDAPGPFLLGLASIQRDGGFRESRLRTYGGASPDKLILGPGDLYVSLKDVTQSGDLLGAVARVPAGIPAGRLTQDTVKLTIRDGTMSDDYLYWLLRSPEYRAYCRAHAMGTTNLSLSRDDFLALPVPEPTAGRLALVELLGLLDSKIDSNRRLAALLEQTAAALFRARFVDYAGIHEFEERETGRIPTGWRAGALTDLGRFVNGKAITKSANGRGRPILRIKELNGGVDHCTPRTDAEVADQHVARYRDILFAWSGSLGVYRWAGPESLINQHIFKVLPENFPAWFVYHWIQVHMAEFRGIARDKATTMGHIQRHHLAEAVVPLPDATAIAAAREALDPIDEHQGVLGAEIATLQSMIDSLLPLLVPGASRLPDSSDAAELIGFAGADLGVAS
jgi:type I restriction enzyme S subunit